MHCDDRDVHALRLEPVRAYRVAGDEWRGKARLVMLVNQLSVPTANGLVPTSYGAVSHQIAERFRAIAESLPIEYPIELYE